MYWLIAFVLIASMTRPLSVWKRSFPVLLLWYPSGRLGHSREKSCGWYYRNIIGWFICQIVKAGPLRDSMECGNSWECIADFQKGQQMVYWALNASTVPHSSCTRSGEERIQRLANLQSMPNFNKVWERQEKGLRVFYSWFKKQNWDQVNIQYEVNAECIHY